MQDFEIYELRYFVEVARLGTMSAAAESLGVTQQAVSKGIRNLEKSLGEDLFLRTPQGLRITRFGSFFLKRAKLAVSTIELAQSAVGDFRSGSRRVITLGLPPHCLKDYGGTLSPANLHQLQERFDDVDFSFIEMPATSVDKGLEDGTLNFGIGITTVWPGVIPEARVETYELVLLDQYPLSVLGSAQNPCSSKSWLTMRDLACGYVAIPAQDTNAQKIVDAFSKTFGVKLSVSPLQMSVADPSELIVDPETFVFLPEQHLRRKVRDDRMRILPMADEHGERLVVPLYLAWRKSMRLGEPERALVEHVTQLYQHRNDA